MNIGNGRDDSAGARGATISSGTDGDIQIFSDRQKDIVHGNILLDEFDTAIAPLMRRDNISLFKFIGGFPEKRFFDDKLFTNRTDGMDSWIVCQMLYKKQRILSR